MNSYLELNNHIPLPLIGDWYNIGEDFGYATYIKQNNIVMLNGIVTNGTGQLAVLPEDYRPSKSEIFFINKNRIDIHPEGIIEVRNKKTDLVNLSGIQFKLSDSIDIPLINNWISYGNERKDWSLAKYTVTDEGLVTLSGLIKQGTSNIIAQLPESIRPSHSIILNNNKRLDIHPDGILEWRTFKSNNFGWITLSAIMYIAATSTLTILDLPLTNNWISYGNARKNWAPATYCKTSDGLVIVSGVIKNGNNQVCAVLPDGYRPSMNLRFSVFYGGNNVEIEIFVSGTIKILTTNLTWINLNGIQFYAKYKYLNLDTETVNASEQALSAANNAVSYASNAELASQNISTTLSNLNSLISEANVYNNTLRNNYQTYQHAIVSLMMVKQNGIYQGTGFIIKYNSAFFICTVAHNVIEDTIENNRYKHASKIIASITTGGNNPIANSVECEVIGVAGYADIAILNIKTTISDLTHLEWEDDNTILYNGDTNIVIGDPLGVDAQSFSHGRIRDTQYIYGNIVKSLCTTAPVLSGNSGSPILNTNFKIIGIISYGMIGTETLSWGANYTVIKHISDYILSRYNPPTNSIIDFKGGTLDAELSLIDNYYYINSNTNQINELVGYYVKSSASNILNVGDKIKKINGHTLGVYQGQYTPVDIYLNPNNSISIELNDNETSIVPSELSINKDIYLGGGNNINNINKIMLCGPQKISDID